METCDKCGNPVAANNSARKLDEILTGEFLWVQDRHLHPTATCVGSPSRVKQILHDKAYRSAYDKLRTLAD